MAEEIDLNKPMVKEQSIKQDCSTGIHDWDRSSVTLQPMGYYTRISMKCYWCNELMIRDEPLNINGIIIETTPEEVQKTKDKDVDGFGPKPPWADPIENRYESEQKEDAFWEAIKKGKR
jgi:hypothetical protein